jgi:hypothetical protein
MTTKSAHSEDGVVTEGCYWIGDKGLVYWNSGEQTLLWSTINDANDWTPIYKGMIYALPEELTKPKLPLWKQEQRKHKWSKK